MKTASKNLIKKLLEREWDLAARERVEGKNIE